MLNKRTMKIRADAVYIGRGSRWGNPFRIGIDGDRETVLLQHEAWLREQYHLLRAMGELRGAVSCASALRRAATAISITGWRTGRARR